MAFKNLFQQNCNTKFQIQFEIHVKETKNGGGEGNHMTLAKKKGFSRNNSDRTSKQQ